MNQIMEDYAVQFLGENGGRCTKEELFSAMKERFKASNPSDKELELELVSSLQITGKKENGVQLYILKSSDKPTPLP